MFFDSFSCLRWVPDLGFAWMVAEYPRDQCLFQQWLKSTPDATAPINMCILIFACRSCLQLLLIVLPPSFSVDPGETGVLSKKGWYSPKAASLHALYNSMIQPHLILGHAMVDATPHISTNCIIVYPDFQEPIDLASAMFTAIPFVSYKHHSTPQSKKSTPHHP